MDLETAGVTVLHAYGSQGLKARIAIRRADQKQSMTQEAIMDKPVVGIDVSKGWLDIVEAGSMRHWRVDNNAEAIQVWLDDGAPTGIELVAFEPTGGYERCLRRQLRARGLAYVRVALCELSGYRRRRGIKAKTDAMDAQLLAGFAAEELCRRGVCPPIEADELLRDLAVRRRQLDALRHAETCRCAMAQTPAVQASHQAVLETLDESLRRIERQMAQHIASQPALAQAAARLQSVSGVGPITANTLLAELPELGQLSGKQIAALVGLAPMNRSSGKRIGHAPTGHGRPGVRRVLFNAARSAIQHNPTMKHFYQRLVVDNQRPGKVALTAIMRKMLVTLNAMQRDQKPWQPTIT